MNINITMSIDDFLTLHDVVYNSYKSLPTENKQSSLIMLNDLYEQMKENEEIKEIIKEKYKEKTKELN